MYNENMDMYIKQSLYSHFDALRGDLIMYTEEDVVDLRKAPKQWIEVRSDGPKVLLRKPENVYTLDVDVFISCPKDGDIFSLERLKGKVKSMFTCLNIYDNEGTFLFSMDIDDEIKVSDYGTIDSSRKGSTVRAVYKN